MSSLWGTANSQVEIITKTQVTGPGELGNYVEVHNETLIIANWKYLLKQRALVQMN
jgi:hypothetical protein